MGGWWGRKKVNEIKLTLGGFIFFSLGVGFVRDNVVLSCALARCLRRFPKRR